MLLLIFIVLDLCLLFSFIIVIEHLPQELTERFTDMREMDLSVQSKFK